MVPTYKTIACFILTLCTITTATGNKTTKSPKYRAESKESSPAASIFSYLKDHPKEIDGYLDNIGNSRFRFPTPPPDRDVNFGGGMITVTVGSSDDAARAVAIQPDGSIVVAGRYDNATQDDFMIARFTPEGTVDTTFSTIGKSLQSFGTRIENAHAVSLQTDGMIIAVGKSDYATSDYFNFAITRLTTDGQLDTSFNTLGKLTHMVGNSTSIARASVLQTDGKLIAGGYRQSGTIWKMALARYTTDGALDTSFNSTGKTVSSLGSNDSILALAVQADGKVVSGGTMYNGANFDFATLRFTTDGALDTSFNTSGKKSNNIGSSHDLAYAIAIQTTGEIALGGSSNNGTNLDYAVARYTTDGGLDTSFNSTGKLTLAIGTTDEGIFGLSVQTDGTHLAAGYSYNGSFDNFALVRFKTDGSLDTSFNTSGKATQAVNASHDRAQGIATLGDAYIILAGRTTNGGPNLDIAIVRYNADGSKALSGDVDMGFGTGP